MMTHKDLSELKKRMNEGDIYDANEFLGYLEEMIPQMRKLMKENKKMKETLLYMVKDAESDRDMYDAAKDTLKEIGVKS